MRRCFNLAASLVLAALSLPVRAAEHAIGLGEPELDGVMAGASAPERALRQYSFEAGRDWPALRYHAARPLDWRRAGALAVPVENPGDRAVPLLLRVDDDPSADGGDASLTGTTVVPPHARAMLVLPLGGTLPGMRGQPAGGFGTPEPGDLPVTERRGRVDLGHVVALHVSGEHPETTENLLIGPPTLRDAVGGGRPAMPVADRFGQSVAGTWPEKVASVADLRRKLEAADGQTRQLARTAIPMADVYGGLAAAERLPATGVFRVALVGGRWTLVTPAGHRFFSLGVDSVAAANPTIVTGREWLFEGVAKGTATLDVGAANLERGLGPDWAAVWPGRTLARLRAWGFNTLGAWSAEDVIAAKPRLPYVHFTDVEGDSARVPMPGGRRLMDPFDPKFSGVADGVAAVMTENRRDDPFLLGYFSGNELPWGEPGGIAAAVMRLGPDSPAKRALVEDLRARYVSPAAFAAAHGLPIAISWDDLLARPFAWPATPNAAALRDRIAFGGRFAERYFDTVRTALKRHDPDHLYLGARLASRPPEVMAACARFCDVISLNLYGRSPAAEADAWRGLGRPVLIGEFHFGSTDRGSFWPGMVAVGSEAARGPAYAAYLRDAVADPAVVGAHWYQYADEPLTGRPYDGENGHIGLAAVTDVPYRGFVEAVAAANREILTRFTAGPSREAARGPSDAWAGSLRLRGSE